jgi:hypothetical protein
MRWYEIHNFKDRLTSIEQFFIEIAANEEQLVAFGFGQALTLPSAEKALGALKTFDEDFATLKRYMLRMDRTLGQELEKLESNERLIEQVSLISLRLRMAEVREPISGSLSVLKQIASIFPEPFRLANKKNPFGEEAISLHKTIINLGKLRGLSKFCSDFLSSQENMDDEIFKPSNVKPDRVLDLIDHAIIEIEALTSIPPAERTRIQGYLDEAKSEALSSTPSWSKIVGALVIVAAITSAIADAPNAAKNLKDAIEYILGSSVEKPLQRFLPTPSNDEKPHAPIGNLA